MVKKLKITRHNLLVNHYIDMGIQVCSNILVVAFLVCIILYISKLNTYKIIDDNNKTVPVNSIQTTMQKFVNIMAWIMLVVIGLSAFISVV